MSIVTRQGGDNQENWDNIFAEAPVVNTKWPCSIFVT